MDSDAPAKVEESLALNTVAVNETNPAEPRFEPVEAKPAERLAAYFSQIDR